MDDTIIESENIVRKKQVKNKLDYSEIGTRLEEYRMDPCLSFGFSYQVRRIWDDPWLCFGFEFDIFLGSGFN